MSKFTLEVISSIERPDDSPYYNAGTKSYPVTEAEIYEAISVYLRTKGFTTKVVSVVKEQTNGESS